jgi:hypothetical protein
VFEIEMLIVWIRALATAVQTTIAEMRLEGVA